MQCTFQACGHTISCWYDDDGLEDDGLELTEELSERLAEEAESRARALIPQDYVSGELNCLIGDTEIRGWWRTT